MKPSFSKSVFNLFTVFTLLVMLLGMLPTSPVQAKALASPLLVSGDFVWAKGLGGTNFESSYDIAMDSSGNVYTVGDFWDTVDFDPGAGTFNLTSAGNADIFISKLDSSGNFVWAKSMGGANSNGGKDIALDSSGNVYTTGGFYGTADFDPGAGTFNLTSVEGSSDIFVSKLDSSGNFVWARSLGGTSFDLCEGIALDSSGNVYTTGTFQGTADLDPGVGTFNLTSAGNDDIFISKLDSSGNFVWARSLSGTSNEYGLSLAQDSSGNIYTTGYFLGTVDFDPGASSFNLTSAGGNDSFVSKLDSSGNFIWARNLGGASDEAGTSIALDSSGNVYTTGSFYGTADFDPGAGSFNLASAGSGDIFISKLDSSGNFVWARSLGGTDSNGGKDIALDSGSNVYTTGWFMGTADLDPGASSFNLTSAGLDDVFVSKLDSEGNFVWAKGLGGTSSDWGRSLALDSSGNIYTTGGFYGTADFDPGTGSFNLTSAGSGNIFISKLENIAPGVRYITPDGTGDCSSWANACTLQTALIGAVSGDELWAAAGTYKPTIGTDRNTSFQLKSGVAVYGGFTGTETARDQRDPAANLTILSGEIGAAGNSDNSYQVIANSSVTDATLDGFSITAGNANGVSINYGGGMYNYQSSNLILTNITFSNNSARDGAGMFNASSNPTLANVTFSNNSATGLGGGMANGSSNPILTNVTFSGNSAEYGGGMYNQSGSPTLTNVTFSSNSAIYWGGGMFNVAGSSPQIRNTLFWGNTAPTGAQIHNISSTPVVSDSVVQDGYAGGTNILTTDPLLGTLGNYGGLTQTLPLLASSSAINTGNDAVCPVTDQRGVARPQGSHCDIGAFEFIPRFTDLLIMNSGAWNKYDFTTGSYLSGVWTGTAAGCTPALIDYNGDGSKEYSQLCGGAWHFYNKNGTYNKGIWVGDFPGSVPVPGDYNGDGVDEPILFYAGAWHYFDFATSAYNPGLSRWTGTAPGCVPAPLDYNGDGKLKFSLFCGGPWHFYNSDGSYNQGVWIGGSTSNIPVPADYDGNGAEEVVLFASGVWHFFDFSTGLYNGARSTYTGLPEASAKPAPIDYNKDGSLDFVQYANGTWYFYSANGSLNKSIATGSPSSAVPMTRRFLP